MIGAFITWERHRRTRGIASALGLDLVEISATGPRYWRYWAQVYATLIYLSAARPKLVFVQNPSIVLTVLVLIWRWACSRKSTVVMDAHNEAVDPKSHPWMRHISRWAIRQSFVTLVTNDHLAEKVSRYGGMPLVLPDPVPAVKAAPPPILLDGHALRLMVIATYEKDEPIKEILEAAAKSPNVHFRFTGNFRKLPDAVVRFASSNVSFLGFLSDEDYWSEMRDNHAVMDLTTLDNCLVCGAYEAVAIGRPLVLSHTQALRTYFRAGAEYTDSDPVCIANALMRLRANYAHLSEQIRFLKPTLQEAWQQQAKLIMNGLTSGARPCGE